VGSATSLPCAARVSVRPSTVTVVGLVVRFTLVAPPLPIATCELLSSFTSYVVVVVWNVGSVCLSTLFPEATMRWVAVFLQ